MSKNEIDYSAEPDSLISEDSEENRPRFLTQTKYADLIGVTRQQITNYKRKGRIVFGTGEFAKKVDVYATDQKISAMRDPDRGGKRPSYVQQDKDQPISSAIGEFDDAESYTRERIRLTRAQADRAELNLSKEAADLCEKEKVEKLAFEHARRAQKILLSIPNRMCGQLSVLTDPLEIKDELLKEIQFSIREISDFRIGE